jgi:hypothetical protein
MENAGSQRDVIRPPFFAVCRFHEASPLKVTYSQFRGIPNHEAQKIKDLHRWRDCLHRRISHHRPRGTITAQPVD